MQLTIKIEGIEILRGNVPLNMLRVCVHKVQTKLHFQAAAQQECKINVALFYLKKIRVGEKMSRFPLDRWQCILKHVSWQMMTKSKLCVLWEEGEKST